MTQTTSSAHEDPCMWCGNDPCTCADTSELEDLLADIDDDDEPLPEWLNDDDED